MRRLSGVAIVVLLLGLSVPVAALGGTEHIKDKFISISWWGSDGSLPWSGPWTEIGDDGDEKKGNVRVVSSGNCASGNCMRLSALTTLLGDIGAVRAADTDGLEELELGFDVHATGSLLGSELQVQVSAGEGWETVKEYEWGPQFTDHPTIEIGEDSSEEFQVRFLFNGALLAGEVFIDNVEISGNQTEEDPTTTTTTTTTSTTTTTTTTTTAPPISTTTTTPTTTKTPTTTTTTRPNTTTSTTSPSITTTTPGQPTTSTRPGDQGEEDDFTVGTSTTTTTVVGAGLESGSAPGSGSGAGGEGGIPDGSGIRAAARGLQANFQGDVFGEVRTVSSIDGVDFEADYNMAVEVIEASWGWMVLLGLVVAYSIVTGLDRKRGDLST